MHREWNRKLDVALKEKSLVVITFLFFTFSNQICADSSTIPNSTRMVLHINKEGSFEVLYDRATSTATGAVLFGLVGAAVEEGLNQSNDKTIEKQILQHIPNPSCSTPLLESLYKTLKSSGSVELLSDETLPVLTLNIYSCGFRIINSTNLKIAAYVDVKMEIINSGQKEPILEEKILIHGKQRLSLTEFLATPDAINMEFINVLEKAGVRIANKIIYR